MPRTALTIRSVSRAGLNLNTQSQAVDSDDNAKFLNTTGDVDLVCDNSAVGSPVTVSLVIAKQVDGASLSATAKQVTVPANTVMEIGGFPADIYNQTSGDDVGYVYINVSADTKLLAKRKA